jgi:hypothetical protein
MVRRRDGRKRALGSRMPMMVPAGINQRWSLDFVCDTLADGRRFRVLCVLDDFSRECLAAVVDTSLGGMRVVRELELVVSQRGCPTPLSPITVPNSLATRCCAGPPSGCPGTTFNPASRCRTPSSKASTASLRQRRICRTVETAEFANDLCPNRRNQDGRTNVSIAARFVLR